MVGDKVTGGGMGICWDAQGLNEQTHSSLILCVPATSLSIVCTISHR